MAVDVALGPVLEAPRQLQQLPGDVGLLAIDEQSDRATVVRSCGGRVPWLVLHTNDLTVISTRVSWFPRLVPEHARPDVMARVASSDGISLPDRRSSWAGVRSIPSGAAAVLERGRPLREGTYWDPVELTPMRSVGRRAVGEAAAALREALVVDLESELAEDGTNLFALSGGVDSSVVAALATGSLGRTVMSFNLASPEGSSTDKLNQRYLDSIYGAVKPRRTWQFRFGDEDWIPLAQRAPKLGMCIPHPALSVLPSIVAEAPVSVYCGGELADDLFAGPYLMWMDWFEALGAGGLIRSVIKPDAGTSRRALVRRRAGVAVRRMRGVPSARMFLDPLPDYFRADIRAEHAEWLHRTTERFRSDEKPYAHLSMMRELDGWLLQNWEVCSELGIRRSVPFATRAVMELACSVHPSDHALPPKRLIRTGLRHDVPELNLLRVDKGAEGGWGPAHLVSIEVPPEVRSLLSDERRETTADRSTIVLQAGAAERVAVVAGSFRDPSVSKN